MTREPKGIGKLGKERKRKPTPSVPYSEGQYPAQEHLDAKNLLVLQQYLKKVELVNWRGWDTSGE